MNWTHEIPARKMFGTTKYPQEKMLDPQNTREKKNPRVTQEEILFVHRIETVKNV